MFFSNHHRKTFSVWKDRKKREVFLVFPNFMCKCFSVYNFTENAIHWSEIIYHVYSIVNYFHIFKALPRIFASGYALCELLRSKRARSASKQRVPLLCENTLFLFPHIDDALGKELLGWPHWVLKCRYTQLGILFGKFWKNAREASKNGRDLPVSPCHFISVRESVQAKDPQFFEHAEWLRPAFESSNDIGQNVFDDMTDYQDVADVIGAFCGEPTQLNFERVNITLVQSNFYTRAKESAARELETHKRPNVN